MEVLSTTTREITPDEAYGLSGLVYEGVQRNIRPVQVGRLLDDMRSGKWGLCEDMIIIASCGERRVLLAGNHRMRALSLHDAPMLFTVQERMYASDEELRQDYIRATNGGASFTMRDKILALEADKKIELSMSWTSAAASSLRLISTGFSGSGQSAQSDNSLIEALERWETPIRAYVKSTHGCYSKEEHIAKRASVMAIGMLTFRFQPAPAIEFWQKLWNNDGLRKGEPEWALRQFLTNTKAFTGGQGSLKYACTIVAAWNAHMENRELQFVRSSNDTDLKIKGTPINASFRDWRGLLGEAK